MLPPRARAIGGVSFHVFFAKKTIRVLKRLETSYPSSNPSWLPRGALHGLHLSVPWVCGLYQHSCVVAWVGVGSIFPTDCGPGRSPCFGRWTVTRSDRIEMCWGAGRGLCTCFAKRTFLVDLLV